MLRSGFYNLATRAQCSPTTVACLIARPASVVLSGRLSDAAFFSTKPKMSHEDEYSDASSKNKTKKALKASNGSSSRAAQRPARYNNNFSTFRPLLSGFDEMFARDPFFSPFFRRPDPFDDIMPVLRSFPMLDDERKKTLVRSSLGYEIKESDGAYEIAVQIPDDFDASDMTVELENDGTVLHISGELKIEDEGVVSEQYFDKRFTVGENVDTENIQANFHEGLLVLKAPKLEPDVAEEPKRAIPISKKPHSMLDQEQVTQTNYSDAFDESDWAETGKEAGPKDKGKGAQ